MAAATFVGFFISWVFYITNAAGFSVKHRDVVPGGRRSSMTGARKRGWAGKCGVVAAGRGQAPRCKRPVTRRRARSRRPLDRRETPNEVRTDEETAGVVISRRRAGRRRRSVRAGQRRGCPHCSGLAEAGGHHSQRAAAQTEGRVRPAHENLAVTLLALRPHAPDFRSARNNDKVHAAEVIARVVIRAAAGPRACAAIKARAPRAAPAVRRRETATRSARGSDRPRCDIRAVAAQTAQHPIPR